MNRHVAPDPARVALLTIDVQNDVLDGGPLGVAGTTAALPSMTRVVRAFRAAGRPIVHVVRLYSPDGSNVDLCRRDAFEQGFRALCPGTRGAELVSELLPGEGSGEVRRFDAEALLRGEFQELGPREHAMYKPRWGAFYETGLHAHLRGQGVTTIVLAGANFPNCPRTTLYEASERDYRAVMLRDAVSGTYDRGIEEVTRIGVEVVTADAWIERMG